MSRQFLAVALAAAVSAPLAAQAPVLRTGDEIRAELTRLDAELAVLAAARSRAQQETAPQRAARVVSSGDIAAVFWSAVPDSAARMLVHRADSILTRSGVVPAEFSRSLVFVQRDAADTAAALAAPELAGRRRLELGFAMPLRAIDDWWVLGPLLTTYAASLDTVWNAWSQNAWGFVRWPERAATSGGRELLNPSYSVAGRCLVGESRGCRLFLGLDADPHPYGVRFTPDELRTMLGGYYGGFQGLVACRSGDDDACVRVLEAAPYSGTGGIPAGGDTRAGLLAAVAALHGPDVLRAALADREGSVGERLARATGIGVDSLALEWRAWVLSGGRPRHVRAGIGELLTALLTVSLLVYLSTRSGPWH